MLPEKMWKVLQHDAYATAQIAGVNPVEVDTIKEYLAIVEIVEASEQPDQSAFAGSGRSDDGELFTRMYGEGHTVQYRSSSAGSRTSDSRIAASPRRRSGRVTGLAGLMNDFVPVEGLEDAFSGGHGPEQDVRLLAQGHDGLEQHVDEPGEENHFPERQFVLDHRRHRRTR